MSFFRQPIRDKSSVEPPPKTAQNKPEGKSEKDRNLDTEVSSSSAVPNIRGKSETHSVLPTSEDVCVQSSSKSVTPPKKRLNECSSQGAVPKTRSLPATQAAAAALNRAKRLNGSPEIETKVGSSEPKPQPLSCTAPCMVRLGPGYSVMATEDKKPALSDDIGRFLVSQRARPPSTRSRDHGPSRDGTSRSSDSETAAPATLSELAKMFSPNDENMAYSDVEDDA